MTHDTIPAGPPAPVRLRAAETVGRLIRAAEGARRHAFHLREQRHPGARDAALRAADLEHAARLTLRCGLLELAAELGRLTPAEARAALELAHDQLEALT